MLRPFIETHDLPPKVMERAITRLNNSRERAKYMELSKSKQVEQKYKKNPPKSFLNMDKLFG